MKIKASILFTLSLVIALTLSTANGDEIILKNGETLQGRITYEADDIVKIELQISASIKETKIIARGDIEKIVKESPDSVAFKEIQSKMPVGSLTNAGTYRSLIETGPDAFLKSFPESVHAGEVKAIKATLEEELDKVERGFIKLEEDWISPQEQAEFETLIKSRIEFLRMQAASRSGNYNGIITAMRSFQAIDENYYATPAFPKAVELAQQILPALGRQLQGMLRDVEYRNAEWERNKATLDEIAQAQIEAARKREDDAYQAGLAADQKAGIKWVRINTRSKSSIENYLKLAGSELNRIREYDVEQLKKKSAMLLEADQLIAKGNFELAQTKLNEAKAISGLKGSDGSSPSNNSKNSGYVSALSAKLKAKLDEVAEKEKARAEAAKSEALAANLKSKKGKPKAKEEKEEDDEAEGEEEPAEEKPKEVPEDMFAALSGNAPASTKEDKTGEKTDNPTTKTKSTTEEDADERPRPVAVDGGGGFSLSLIIPIITVLLLVTVIALKFLGIGTKKDSEDGEAAADE